MTAFFNFACVHPWWAFLYLCVVGTTVCNVCPSFSYKRTVGK